MTPGSEAGELYAQAVSRLERTGAVIHLARARLVYGEWLRREQHRVQAREQLRVAHAALEAARADAFADRAARELRATGGTPRAREAVRSDDLTAQERHIARHVASGATHQGVAGRCLLRPPSAGETARQGREVQEAIRTAHHELAVYPRS